VRSEGQSSYLEALHAINDASDELREAAEQAQCWEALERACFFQSYCDGKSSLILNLDTSGTFDNVLSASAQGNPNSLIQMSIFISKRQVFDCAIRDEIEKQKMLIRDVQIVKDKNGAVLPSIVRLCFGYDEVKKWRTSGIYLNAMQGRFEFLFGGTDGKLGAISLTGRNMFSNDSSPRKIEGGMQVVQDIPNNQSQIKKSIVDLWDFVRDSFIIFIDCGGVSILKRQKCDFQLRDVFIGPFDFLAGVSKECAHRTGE
jgi:hypothetical protein